MAHLFGPGGAGREFILTGDLVGYKMLRMVVVKYQGDFTISGVTAKNYLLLSELTPAHMSRARTLAELFIIGRAVHSPKLSEWRFDY